MTGWLLELRYAARALWKSPALSGLAVLALSLGIGLTTTMFSIVDGALLEGLPFEDSHRIMHLERSNPSRGIESMEVTVHDYVDWRAQQRSFQELAAYYSGTVNLSGTERAERYDGAFITADGFEPLGVRPHLGRLFREDEDDPGAPPVILLGWHVWQERFAGDSSAVGRTVKVNGEQATIVGVMPDGFRFPLNQDVWVPMKQDPLELPRGEGLTLEVYGRLADGVGRDRAAADLGSIAGRLAAEHPETNEGVTSLVKPFTEEYIGDEPRAMLWTMLGAVFLVLLIACANVANLLLARASTRARELAIRSAIGASRLRVVLQLLGEGLVLAGAGALLGVGLGWVGIALFNRAIAPTDPPFWIEIGLDPSVLLFVLGTTVLAGVLSGIVPALKATGKGMGEVLKDESWGSTGFRMGRLARVLVVTEVALSVGLLVGAGLMIKSVVNLRNIDYGFPTADVFTARLGLFETDFPDTTSRAVFFRDVEERLAALPGAASATIATSLPGVWSGGTPFAVEGETYDRDQDHPDANWVAVTPSYFETFEVEPLEGRVFSSRDRRESLPVTVVNRTFARKHFPDGSPVGRRVRQGRSDSEEPWRTIVGVVPDMYLDGVENEEPEGMYVPLAQADARFVSLAIRTAGDPMRLAGEAREAVASVDADTPLYWVQSLQASIDQNTWFYRVFGTLFVVFGAVALFLASVGLYGVMSTSVSRRTTEMGIRMALGAQGRDVLRLVLRQGMVQIGIGVLLGIGLAFLLARGLDLLLFQVQPWDPTTFAAIVLVLAATGLLASLVPARRATRVEPMAALRYE